MHKSAVHARTACQGTDVGLQKLLKLHYFYPQPYLSKNLTNECLVRGPAGSAIRCPAQLRQKMLACIERNFQIVHILQVQLLCVSYCLPHA